MVRWAICGREAPGRMPMTRKKGDQKDKRPAKVSDEEGVGWNAFEQGKEDQEIVAEDPWNEVVLNEFHFI